MTEEDKNIAIPITDDDKRLISRYMNWPLTQKQDGYTGQYYISVALDANAAALCVQEMQKRGDYFVFEMYAIGLFKSIGYRKVTAKFIPWLFNPENFFGAMASWIKEVKK